MKRAQQNSPLWRPLISTGITTMTADGNCGFRAVAHRVYDREAAWPLVRKDLLDALESNPKGYLQDVAVMTGDKASLQSLPESISPFKWSAELSKWFSSDMHAQITAGAYDLFVVMISSSGSQVLVRAPSSFQSAEEIRAALHTARLLGMLFRGPGSVGRWDFVDLEELGVRELLGSRAALIASSAV